jgi:uncharacterized protein YcbK (DUF882 family)
MKFEPSWLSTKRCLLKRAVALFFIFPILALIAIVAGSSSVVADSSLGSSSLVERHLRLYHTHTGERIDIIYRRGVTYLPEAEAKLDYFLRDHRTGDVKHYDPHVFDILSDVAAAVGHPDAEIDIICGYRTPWSNEFLRARSEGVAKNSQHMQAHAIDIRIPGVDTLTLRNAALALGRGGVGYYPRSGFVHVDTGRVRNWCYGCNFPHTTAE